MNRNMSLCIDNSAKLLATVFPGQNWAWFLSVIPPANKGGQR